MSDLPAVSRPGALTASVDAVFAEDGPLTRAFDTFEVRTGQRELAHAVASMFETGGTLLAEAGTGTGKTLAFAAPILDRLSRNTTPAPVRGTRVLVLAPTRELAGQIATSFGTYGAGLNLRVVMVCGGAKIGGQIRQLERGAHILVATPGRLIHLMAHRAVSLDMVDTLILDEADQMLDLGSKDELDGILECLPEERRTHLVSVPVAAATAVRGTLSSPADLD